MTVTLKPLPAGLYGRGHIPRLDLQPAFAGQWIQVGWKDIEKVSGIYDFTALDAARQRMLTVNPGWHARYRLFSGRSAPDYLKAEVGTYACVDSTISGTWDVVCWWEPLVAQRYDLFIKAVAAHVEADHAVVEVSASMTGSVFAEPLIRQMSDQTTRASMLAAGYTWEKDQAAVNAMIGSHAKHLHATHTGVAFNPWQNAMLRTQDIASTLALIDQWRSTMGKRLVLENNSLDSNIGAVYAEMYQHMQTLGHPIGYQTRGAVRLSEPLVAIQNGIKLGATAIEPNDSDIPDLATAQSIVKQLQANKAA